MTPSLKCDTTRMSTFCVHYITSACVWCRQSSSRGSDGVMEGDVEQPGAGRGATATAVDFLLREIPNLNPFSLWLTPPCRDRFITLSTDPFT
ncbi:hypothetical protein VZT92_016586 [Zoarces viviparus]|uniref:Uncharacterized protein n=1 Tax=Zoarces viviparus TaxID=48416 RepID=A0AAW1EUM1_ZOAVI